MYIYPYVTICTQEDVCRISYICRIFVSVGHEILIDICVLIKDVPEEDDLIEVDDLISAPEIEFKFIPSQNPGTHIPVKGYLKMVCQI